MIFDSHAHYDDEEFDNDREEVICELKRNGIIGILNCGSSIEGSRKSVLLSKKYDFIYAAVGIHPEFANMVDEKMLGELRSLCSEKKVRAIGEIGLDYHYDENPDREIQKSAFIKQMELAKSLNMPVVIHNREAHFDTMEIIKMFPDVIGSVHCFSGSSDMAKECVRQGYYIGVTGVVTFKNARKIADVIRVTPLERLLVETDCPYMAPEPLRGKRNRSDYIKYIIEKIAQIKEVSYNEVERQTTQNIKHLTNLQ